jgi:hypothetical protein
MVICAFRRSASFCCRGERKQKEPSRLAREGIFRMGFANSGAKARRENDEFCRHPEVAAQRTSKDAAEALGPSPFEARFARTSG